MVLVMLLQAFVALERIRWNKEFVRWWWRWWRLWWWWWWWEPLTVTGPTRRRLFLKGTLLMILFQQKWWWCWWCWWRWWWRWETLTGLTRGRVRSTPASAAMSNPWVRRTDACIVSDHVSNWETPEGHKVSKKKSQYLLISEQKTIDMKKYPFFLSKKYFK